MHETAKGLRIFLGSALTTCVVSLFLVPPKSTLFFLLFAVAVITGTFWIIMMGVKHY